MFPSLVAAIRELPPLEDAAGLRAAIALRDLLDARIASGLVAFDREAGWDLDGATSLKAWLRDEGMCPPDAHQLAMITKRIARLPAVREAWESGRLSTGQVRVIERHLIDRHVGRFTEIEAKLVPHLVGLSIADTNKVMAEWRARADADDPGTVGDEPASSLHHSKTLDDRFVTNGAFEALEGATVGHALTLADSGDLTVAPPQRRAQALVDVCEFFLRHHEKPPVVRNRPHVNLVLDAADLQDEAGPRAELVEYGIRLDAAATSALLCDCEINRVVADKIAGAASRILDYGRTTKNVGPSLWAALMVRDRHCRYPGCDRPAHWCDAHHVQWWSKGGPTNLDNLVVLCRRHHRLLHGKRKPAEVKLHPDATLEITEVSGHVRTSHPPGQHPMLRA